MNFTQDELNSINSASTLFETCERKEQEARRMRAERVEDATIANLRASLPMTAELKALVEGLQEQNRILQSQIDEAKKDGEEAKKEAKKARIFSWISFGVATAISVAALVVSIIALF